MSAYTEYPSPQTAGPERRRGLIAALAYANFVAGLAVFFIEKDDHELRFHGMQSALITALKILCMIVLYVGMFGFMFSQMSTWRPGPGPEPEFPSFFGWVFVLWGVFYLVFIALFVVRVVFAILGYQLRHPRLPLLGRLAERLARS